MFLSLYSISKLENWFKATSCFKNCLSEEIKLSIVNIVPQHCYKVDEPAKTSVSNNKLTF